MLQHKKKLITLTVSTLFITVISFGSEKVYADHCLQHQVQVKESYQTSNRVDYVSWKEKYKYHLKVKEFNRDRYRKSASNTLIHSKQDEDMKTHLRILFEEHAVLAAYTSLHRYEGKEQEFSETQQALEQNTHELAIFVERVYGSEKMNHFVNLWNHHNFLFLEYAEAVKTNDTERREKAVQELKVFVEDISNLLSTDRISVHDLRWNFHQHVELEKTVIDAHAAGDFEAEDRTTEKAREQAQMMADLFIP